MNQKDRRKSNSAPRQAGDKFGFLWTVPVLMLMPRRVIRYMSKIASKGMHPSACQSAKLLYRAEHINNCMKEMGNNRCDFHRITNLTLMASK